MRGLKGGGTVPDKVHFTRTNVLFCGLERGPGRIKGSMTSTPAALVPAERGKPVSREIRVPERQPKQINATAQKAPPAPVADSLYSRLAAPFDVTFRDNRGGVDLE